MLLLSLLAVLQSTPAEAPYVLVINGVERPLELGKPVTVPCPGGELNLVVRETPALSFSEGPLSFRYPKAHVPVVKSRSSDALPLNVMVPLGSGSHIIIHVYEQPISNAEFEGLLRTTLFPDLQEKGITVNVESWSSLTRSIAGRDVVGKRWSGQAIGYRFFMESFVLQLQGRSVWILFSNNPAVPEYDQAFRLIAGSLQISARPGA